MTKVYRLLLCYWVLVVVFLMPGCQRPSEDPVDIRAWPQAVVDTVQLKIEKSLNESSGLVRINTQLWTHNDSGGEPILYAIDSTGKQITRSVTIAGVENNDWEEVTRDSTHVYIGNFGNNLGRRKNLEIYKVDIDALLLKENITPEIIKFSYPEQTEFPGSYNHNFDCEAFIVMNDSLYLFTKNWADKHCSIYRIPIDPGDYNAELISTFDTRGVITGATINQRTGDILLLGYNLDRGISTFYPFVWKLSNYKGYDFFNGDHERFNLSITRQAEAICWDKADTYFISAENENGGHASLFSLSFQ